MSKQDLCYYFFNSLCIDIEVHIKIYIKHQFKATYCKTEFMLDIKLHNDIVKSTAKLSTFDSTCIFFSGLIANFYHNHAFYKQYKD